ncbi:unnamed protein product [Diamesa serratosioi]
MNKHECNLRPDSRSHLPKVLPDASYFTRFKRRFKKLCLVSSKHPEVFKHLRSNTGVENESKRQVNKNYFSIHPLSTFRQNWNIVIFVVMLLHKMLTPLAIGFYLDFNFLALNILMSIDLFLCIILFLEVLLLFRTGYIIKETNKIVLHPKVIARKYLKDLIPDLLGCLPFVYFATLIVKHRDGAINGATIIYMIILYVFHFYRFERLLFYWSCIPLMLQFSEKSSIIIPLVLRTIYLWHWTSCLKHLPTLFKTDLDFIEYRVIKEQIFDVSPPNVSERFYGEVQVDMYNWQLAQDIIALELAKTMKNSTIINKYTRSMMITLKCALQSGYSEETSLSGHDMLMTTIFMFGGWIYSTYVLLVVSNVIIASDISEYKYEEMANEIKAFCNAKKLSQDLSDRIAIYFQYKYKMHYFNEDAIKNSISVNLRKEILMHSCCILLSKVSLFKDLSKDILENIVKCLKLEIYFTNGVIVQANTIGESMFFIQNGTAAIMSPSGVELGHLSDGSHFGEVALLLKGQKRIASIIALEMCEIYKLSQKDFRKVILPHPNILNKLEIIAIHRVKTNEHNEKYQQPRTSIF